jgi:hypothetical protein
MQRQGRVLRCQQRGPKHFLRSCLTPRETPAPYRRPALSSLQETFRGSAQAGPNATADHISTLTDCPGIDGIYDFKAYYDHGLGPDSATVVTYDPQAKSWKWLSKPSGEPLP